jgi:hypothetical protein
MFYCPTCGEWIVETALSRVLGAEVGKLEHDIEKHHPEWAGLLAVAAPLVTFVIVAWAGPRLYRWLK